MAEKKNAPKLRIEDDEPTTTGVADPVEDSTTHEGNSPTNSDTTSDPKHPARAKGFSQAMSSLRTWLSATFPGHENAVLFGFLGFVIAILIFIIGFWRTLLIALIVLLGVAIGQMFDGDPKIFNAIRKFVRENRN